MKDGKDDIHINGAIGSAAGRRSGLEGNHALLTVSGFRWNDHGFAFGQQCGAGSGFRIASAEMARLFDWFAVQQALGLA